MFKNDQMEKKNCDFFGSFFVILLDQNKNPKYSAENQSWGLEGLYVIQNLWVNIGKRKKKKGF